MTRRDLSLAAVAALAVLALAVIAWAEPPAPGQIISGLVGLGAMAIGRVSGANGEREQ